MAKKDSITVPLTFTRAQADGIVKEAILAGYQRPPGAKPAWSDEEIKQCIRWTFKRFAEWHGEGKGGEDAGSN